jgi:hypothetical protein
MSAPDEPADRDEPFADDIERVSAAVRATAPSAGEPDWTQLSAAIGAAVDGEARRQRRVRVLAIGGAVLAAAAVAALLVWPRPHEPNTSSATASVDAAGPSPTGQDDVHEVDAELAEAIAEELAVPDDLGGITVDDELIGEAAAALDLDLEEEAAALDDALLPDGAWIDELSDEDLERAVTLLDGEPG